MDARERIDRILEGKEDDRLFGKESGQRDKNRTTEDKERVEKIKEQKVKDGRTYTVTINGYKLEVPEGFEVVIDREKVVVREKESSEIVDIVREILKEVKTMNEEGIEVTGAIATI
ncbi:hypothetical protein [Hydrogenivirga sp. 128-5-R1-1]|uniref:hypothetical protein n=1 Tax=Hydrogenivirga sp. 128-5-R1-1 TaxID=392423 RepID=UPI00015F18D1|nr:hypothetical protein [Hydrogenivirga sp. 128-5-R1-1]EDP75385.1 hypothetical protein HG1285_15511 [Hydrogenivirga sp. 128-5-R1-1]